MADHNQDLPPMPVVTPDRPCPACGKGDWCLLREDGKRGFCNRVASTHGRFPSGHLHIYEDDPLPPRTGKSRTRTASAKSIGPKATTDAQATDKASNAQATGTTGKPKQRNQKPPEHWQRVVGGFAEDLRTRRPEYRDLLASWLNMPPGSISVEEFPLVGWCGASKLQPIFSCPETDGSGRVIGYVERYGKGCGREVQGKYLEKIAPPGSSRGLTIPTGWKDRPGPFLNVEAFSDTAAMTFAGMCCVGRPNNNMGAEQLAELLKDWPADREIVICGENDQKPNGDWPGDLGARTVAGQLLCLLNRPITIAFPPDGAKDVREWLTSPDRADRPWPELGVELLSKMMASTETLTPTGPPPGGPEGINPNQWVDKPENCHRLAAKYLSTLAPPGQPSPLRFWRDEFHEWKDGCYAAIPEGDMKCRLSNWCRDEFLEVRRLEMLQWLNQSADGRGPEPKTREATRYVVGNVRDALAGLCCVDSTKDAPQWLDGVNGPDPKRLVAMRNGAYDVDDDRLLPPSPSFFTFAATEFDYDPHAPEPASWLRFIAGNWPAETDTPACLQEWMGYLLVPDNSQQKYLYLLGVPRSGKSLTTNVIQQLVGKKNTTGIKLPSLARQFGLEDLLNKSVGLIGDARLSKNDDVTGIQGAILNISGDDPQSVARKHKTSVNCHLPTRLVFTSNEMPSWIDASGAVSARMILLRYTITHEGKEDVELLNKFTPELPGIFLWAMAGFRRLRRRGYFVQPARSQEDVREIREAAAPIRRFVLEKCVLGAEEWCWSEDLYEKWKGWRTKQGEHPGSEGSFGKLLRIAFPDVKPSKNKKDKSSDSGYRTHRKGIRLRYPGETEGIVIDDDDTTNADLSDLFGSGEGVKGGEGQTSNAAGGTHLKGSDPSALVSEGEGQKSINSETRLGAGNEAENAGDAPVPYGETYSGESFTTLTPSPCRSHPGWLYASRKLALELYPESQVTPTVQVGTEVFYRLTPDVVVWFEHAVAVLNASKPPQHDAGEAVAAMQVISSFARDRFPGGALDDARAEARARGGPRPLPEPEWVPRV